VLPTYKTIIHFYLVRSPVTRATPSPCVSGELLASFIFFLAVGVKRLSGTGVPVPVISLLIETSHAVALVVRRDPNSGLQLLLIDPHCRMCRVLYSLFPAVLSTRSRS
jgi:hypothetical protein